MHDNFFISVQTHLNLVAQFYSKYSATTNKITDVIIYCD